MPFSPDNAPPSSADASRPVRRFGGNAAGAPPAASGTPVTPPPPSASTAAPSATPVQAAPHRAPASAPAAGDGKEGVNPGLQAFLDRCAELDTIELDVVLEALEATPNQDGDKTKWKLPNGHNLWHKKNTQIWKDLNEDSRRGGGNGPVRLVAYVLDIKPGAAARWLEARFHKDGKLRDDIVLTAADRAPPESQGFRAPPQFPEDNARMIAYLTGERGIPASLVHQEIARGFLYATRRPLDPDAPDEDKVFETHCVFASPAGAELRCVLKHGFKGTGTGSDPDRSGYAIPYAEGAKEKLVCMTEAAVDAQSYRALFPGRFTKSTNGAGRFTLMFELALETLDNLPGYGVRMALDADNPGDIAAQKIFNAFYVSAALAKHLKIEPKDVEEWFRDGSLSTSPNPSPHELFFGTNAGPQAELPVYEKVVVPTGVGNKTQDEWHPTGTMAPPIILLHVNKDVGHLKRGQTVPVKVTPGGYAYVTEKLNVRRDRPPMTKDWNDEMLRLGSSFVRDYEECAKVGFADGRVPALPPELAALRTRPGPVLTPRPQGLTGPERPAAPAPPAAEPPAPAPPGAGRVRSFRPGG
jgi:hypothetical protein